MTFPGRGLNAKTNTVNTSLTLAEDSHLVLNSAPLLGTITHKQLSLQTTSVLPPLLPATENRALKKPTTSSYESY